MTTPSSFGNAPKKKLSTRNKWIIGGVAAVGTVGAVWYFKRQSASSSANATQSGIDPNTGVPYADETSGAGTGSGIDPNTGVPYADEYGGYSGAVGSVPGLLGTYDPLTGTYIPGSGSATSTPTTPGTNAEWATAAEAALVADGYNPVNVAGALGAYLAGSDLSANEYSIVQAALAFEGQPPVSVPPPHQGSNNQNTGSGNITVPNEVGQRAAVAVGAIAAKGLVPRLSTGTPKGWVGTITAQNPSAGTKVKTGTTVKLTNTVRKPAPKPKPVRRVPPIRTPLPRNG